MKFGTGTHIYSLQRVDRKNSENLKTTMAEGRHFEKSKNRHISLAVRRIVTKFGIETHIDSHKHVDR